MKQALTCQSQKRQTPANGEMMQERTAEPCLSPQHNRDPLHRSTKQIGKGSCIWQMLKTLSICDLAAPVNRQRQKNCTTMTNFLELTKKIHIHSCLFSEDRETKPNLTKTEKRKGKKNQEQTKCEHDEPEPRMDLRSLAEGDSLPPKRASKYAATTFIVWGLVNCTNQRLKRQRDSLRERNSSNAASSGSAAASEPAREGKVVERQTLIYTRQILLASDGQTLTSTVQVECALVSDG